MGSRPPPDRRMAIVVQELWSLLFDKLREEGRKVTLMKNILAIAGSLAFVAGANAEITGASLTLADFSGGYQNADGSTVAVTDAAPAGADDVWRLWATVDSVADTIAFFGASQDEQVFFHNTITNGTIYNFAVFGTSIDGPNQAFFGIPDFGGAAYDSFLTIGHDGSANTTGGTSSVDDGWIADWEATGTFSTNNAGLFDTSPLAGEDIVSDGQGGFRVLLGQFTVSAGGNFNGGARLGGGGDMVDVTWATPAPGALALFGLAGFAGLRRRRK
jgi:MYXO-CTERM domain-containing protein